MTELFLVLAEKRTHLSNFMMDHEIPAYAAQNCEKRVIRFVDNIRHLQGHRNFNFLALGSFWSVPDSHRIVQAAISCGGKRIIPEAIAVNIIKRMLYPPLGMKAGDLAKQLRKWADDSMGLEPGDRHVLCEAAEILYRVDEDIEEGDHDQFGRAYGEPLK